MSQRFRLPPGCKGLDFQFGAKVNANRRGIVEVPDHLAKDVKRGTADVAASPLVAFSASCGEEMCEGCGFSMFPWQVECPRCRTAAPVVGSQIQEEAA